MNPTQIISIPYVNRLSGTGDKGVIGTFSRAIVLSVGYNLMMQWIGEGQN